jgi:hypothetical protein
MFALWKRWFITDIPFDDFYAPFFFTSGPLVYFNRALSPALVGAVLSSTRFRVSAVGCCSWYHLLDSRWIPMVVHRAVVALVSYEEAWHTRGLTNRSSQPLGVIMTRFDFMKQFREFATLAPASGGSAPSR